MLDVTMLRKNLPEVVARLKTRNFDFPVDAFNELEERRKSVQKKTEELQARRNSLSKDIGMMKKNGEDASELLAQAAAIPGELKALEDELVRSTSPLRTMWMSVLRSVWTSIRQPNFPVRVLLSCAAKSLICTARSLSSCWMCIRVSKAIPNAIRRTSLPLPQ